MYSNSGRFLLTSLIAALIAAMLFLPGLPGDFVLDDVANIVENAPLKIERLDAESLYKAFFSYQMSGTMRVLPTFTFALDYWRAGAMDPATFRITNIVIHAVTTCVLAWFFRSLLLAASLPMPRVRWIAPALALAWAAHPLQVSSVLYVVQRMQTMGTLFLVLALWAYLCARLAQAQGHPGRRGMLLAMLAWLFAMGCKEDAILLPAYTLALELTVLRFAAADPQLASTLRRGYLVATIAGSIAYLFVVLPHYWTPVAYEGRDFSSPERLLTQARVLCMYLGQILLPLPQHMPFFYDGMQPSRGPLQPWTTLPAIGLLMTLLITAWRLRTRWPLFSLGVFLFFAAHLIASNVIGLELAFEHRNHFALIGAVLAAGSLLGKASQRLPVPPVAQAGLLTAFLMALGGATLLRSSSWRDNLTLLRTSAQLAPDSARVWFSLCGTYFLRGGGTEAGRGNPSLDLAIDTCSKGAAAVPYAINSPALLVVMKTIRGDVSPGDWEHLQRRMEAVPMTFDNRWSTRILTTNFAKGVKLDKRQLIRLLDTLARRAPLSRDEYTTLGYFVMDNMAEPEAAITYFTKAISTSTLHDPYPGKLADQLRGKGHPDLATRIEQVAASRRSGILAPGAPVQ